MSGDVWDIEIGFFLINELEHFGLNIDGDDLAFWSLGGEGEGVVAGSGADIGEGFGGREFEEFHGE